MTTRSLARTVRRLVRQAGASVDTRFWLHWADDWSPDVAVEAYRVTPDSEPIAAVVILRADADPEAIHATVSESLPTTELITCPTPGMWNAMFLTALHAASLPQPRHEIHIGPIS